MFSLLTDQGLYSELSSNSSWCQCNERHSVSLLTWKELFLLQYILLSQEGNSDSLLYYVWWLILNSLGPAVNSDTFSNTQILKQASHCEISYSCLICCVGQGTLPPLQCSPVPCSDWNQMTEGMCPGNDSYGKHEFSPASPIWICKG